MKNRFFLLGMAALLVCVFVLPGCSNNSDNPPQPGGNYNLGIKAKGSTGSEQVISVTVSGSTSRVAVDPGDYDFEASLGGVPIITGGTLEVNGNTYTFYDDQGNVIFTFNSNTLDTSGSIPLTAALKAQITAAAGFTVALPDVFDDLSLNEMMVGHAALNGEWIIEEPNPKAMDPGEPPTLPTTRKLIFSGGNWTITDNGNPVESGTFVWCDGRLLQESDSLFIFFRPGKTPNMAAYLFETTLGAPEFADPSSLEEDFLELYNHLIDPLNLSRVSGNTSNEFKMTRAR